MKTNIVFSIGLLVAAATASVQAHVTLPPGGGVAGSDHLAVFRVGHACKGATTTTGLKVRLPAGFKLIEAQPRPGWTLSVQDGEVAWSAASAHDAQPGKTATSFSVRGRLPDKPGTLWFKVLQTCDTGQVDWVEIPSADATAPAPSFPAARLDVVPVGTAAVDVSGAWARATVPGQSGTGVFAKLTAPAGARLVGGSTPAAGVVEVHEMKMEGDVMRMRALPQGLELPPGQTVDMDAGGFHLMLMKLKQAIPAGSTIPLTLRFVGLDGRESTLSLQVPVLLASPNGAAGSSHHH